MKTYELKVTELDWCSDRMEEKIVRVGFLRDITAYATEHYGFHNKTDFGRFKKSIWYSDNTGFLTQCVIAETI